ncbi:Carboxypeptidase Y [Schizosaccharomyces pombe]
MLMKQTFLYFLLTCVVSAQFNGYVPPEQNGGDIVVPKDFYEKFGEDFIREQEESSAPLMNPVPERDEAEAPHHPKGHHEFNDDFEDDTALEHPGFKDKLDSFLQPARDFLHTVSDRLDNIFDDDEDEHVREKRPHDSADEDAPRRKHGKCKGKGKHHKGKHAKGKGKKSHPKPEDDSVFFDDERPKHHEFDDEDREFPAHHEPGEHMPPPPMHHKPGEHMPPPPMHHEPGEHMPPPPMHHEPGEHMPPPPMHHEPGEHMPPPPMHHEPGEHMPPPPMHHEPGEHMPPPPFKHHELEEHEGPEHHRGPEDKEHHKGPKDKEHHKGPKDKEHHKGPKDKEHHKGPKDKEHHKGPKDKEHHKGPKDKEHHQGPKEKHNERPEQNMQSSHELLVIEAFADLINSVPVEEIAEEFSRFLDTLGIEYYGNIPVHIQENAPKDSSIPPLFEFDDDLELSDLTPEQFAYLEMLKAEGIDPMTAFRDQSHPAKPSNAQPADSSRPYAVFSQEENGEHVNLKAFPDHTLRVKDSKPESLGIDTVKQYTGYLDVEDDRHLFFWFFESRNDPENDPVVLWLNGGPGCSSLTGLFMELGPSSINIETLKPEYNPHSWNSNASVIFLDQPINTGFSNGDDSVLDTVTAGKDVYAFLNLFFAKFPQYAHLDFHIAGESYAGHYIPQFAKEIMEHNQGANFFVASGYEMEKQYINLKSVLIGNGLTDPLVQYYFYGKMACESPYGPIMSQEECDRITGAYDTCAKLITGCYQTGFTPVCIGASLYCNNAMIGPFTKTGLNIYDIREECRDQEHLCYPETGAIESYLNQEFVQEALGVEYDYKGCNTEVNIGFLFKGDWMRKTFRDDVTAILEAGLPVLIYAGDADYICNYMGNEAWTDALEWAGQREFYEAELKPWSPNGKEAGRGKSFKNFGYLRLYEAGHMVPFNQPEASLEMLNSWIDGSLFA